MAFDAQATLDALCDAAERCDGEAFAALFTDDGVYHDDFYGAFAGKGRLSTFITDWLHKDARGLRWDMVEPSFENGRLYARYIFSYNSTLPEAKNARAIFEGVSILEIRDDKIASYREVIDCGTAFADMDFHPERLRKICDRRSAALRSREEVARHI